MDDPARQDRDEQHRTRASETSFTDSVAVTSFVAAVVALGLFLLVEARHKEPIMPLRLFSLFGFKSFLNG